MPSTLTKEYNRLKIEKTIAEARLREIKKLIRKSNDWTLQDKIKKLLDENIEVKTVAEVAEGKRHSESTIRLILFRPEFEQYRQGHFFIANDDFRKKLKEACQKVKIRRKVKEK